MSSQPDPEYSGGLAGPETGGEEGRELRGVQDTKDRVLSVVEREFAVSLRQKEQELATIDERILQVRKYLDLVRRGTVKKYYRET